MLALSSSACAWYLQTQGPVVLGLKLCSTVQAKEPDKQWDVTCSYCEVYNELIFDLLQDSSPPLDLRSLYCTHLSLHAPHAITTRKTITVHVISRS